MKRERDSSCGRVRELLPYISFAALCGVLSGVAVFIFKYFYTFLSEFSATAYDAIQRQPLYALLVIPALAVLAGVMIAIHKAVPEARGGGIPRSEGMLRGTLKSRPSRTLFGTFFGSMISYIAALPLGSEGPAVLIGTSLGALCTQRSKRSEQWRSCVMTGGAASGFAVATGAPLTGLLFSLEEIHKRFTPTLVLTASVSILTATYINELLSRIFGISTSLLEVGRLVALDISDVHFLLLFAVIIAVGVCLFDYSIELFHKLMIRVRGTVRPWMKIGAIFMVGGAIAMTVPDAAFSGHHTIYTALELSVPIGTLVLILAVRAVMMLLVTDSGVTGGIFIPTLAIGALFCALAARLMLLFGMSADYYVLFVLLGTCAFLGGTLRAPITAAVFFIEITGQLTSAFLVVLAVFVVNVVVEAVGRKPFYDRVLEDLEAECADSQES